MEHRVQAKKVADYRHIHQKHTDRREYSLNDPLALRKEVPSGANDMKHYSNLQKFAGEDRDRESRVVEQQKQMKTWTIQSIQEREAARQKELEEKRKFEEYQENVAAKARELERISKIAQKEMARKYCDSNEMMVSYPPS